METFISSLALLKYFAVVFFSIVVHECSHAWVAYQLGDSTAKEAGRLTLNPLKHIDPFTTLMLPGLLMMLGLPPFGMAKPVPVNFSRLRNPQKNMMWVGISGPAMNIAIATLLSLVIRLPGISPNNELLLVAIFINLVLATLNMMPIPPLDGSRLVMGLLPRKYLIPYSRLERFGILILAVLIFYFHLFEYVVLPIVFFLGYVLGVNFVGIL
jgi:Zn-dependent protease